MIFYDVFGGLLESKLEFPELRSTLPGTPDWILRATAASAVPVYAEVLGYDDVDVGVRVRALRTPAGYRLEFDDTGVFDISADGREIRWYRPPDGNERVARRVEAHFQRVASDDERAGKVRRMVEPRRGRLAERCEFRE